MPESKVVAIYIGAKKGGSVESVSSALAVAGKGLVGDRYFVAADSRSKEHLPEQEVTLIESEAIEAVNRDENLVLEAVESRRNIVTRGVALNHLVGKDFRVGETMLRGLCLCEPCSRLQRLTRPRMIKALLHRGGLRARIIEGGNVYVGDPVEVVETAIP